MKESNHIIDLHAHILPGIDDGAKSIEESIEMAKFASKMGVTTIVATPHRIKGTYDTSMDDIKKKISILNKEFKKQNIAINLVFGAENYAEFDIDASFTINNKNYLMMEFPASSYPSFCDEVIDNLRKKDIIPIITHPEHNQEIAQNPKIIENLINKGCLMQLDAHSLISRTDKAIRSFVYFLLKNNAYHLIGSNAHSPAGYSVFSKALHILHKFIGNDRTWEMTVEAPKRIIAGEELMPEKITFEEKAHTKFGIRAFARKIIPF